jgi:hypothetical protein
MAIAHELKTSANAESIARRRHQTPIGDLLGVFELSVSDGGGSGELITVPVLTAGPGAVGAELEQPTSATPNATAINRSMFWDSE